MRASPVADTLVDGAQQPALTSDLAGAEVPGELSVSPVLTASLSDW